MLADAEFDLNHTQMGMFQSAVSVPNLFMPIVGGLLLDHRGQEEQEREEERRIREGSWTAV